MNFVLKPSLEHMALAKIVVSLWNENEIRALIIKHRSFNRYSSQWETIEKMVREKALQLSLPEILKEKVLGFVKPIGLQINDWMDFHTRHYDLLLNLPPEFCWTPQGTVDRKKTVEVLLRDENLDMSTCYELACIYCLEYDIIQFWKSMPEDIKESVSCRVPVIIFWSHNMRRKGSRIDYRSEFLHCAHWDNKVAAEYFLQKLTPQERKESLVEATKYICNADFLCFLISEMDEEQQMEVFRDRPVWVLQCFLQWPWQNFFFEIANRMWNFLSRDYYYFILTIIVSKISDGYEDWDYLKLLREFLQESPDALKRFITYEIDTSWLLPFLFDIKDKENVRLILKDISPTVKEGLIYSDKMDFFCQRSIQTNELDFLEFFIQECLPSENEVLKFKEEYKKRMRHFYFNNYRVENRQKWDQLFCFSDESICNYDGRSIEEVESSSSK